MSRVEAGAPVFFQPVRAIDAVEIARLTETELVRPPASPVLLGVATLPGAGPDHIAYCDGRAHHAALAATRAGAVIVTAADVARVPDSAGVFVALKPQQAFITVLLAFHPDAAAPHVAEVGRDGATVDPSAIIEDGVRLAPGAVIGPRVEIGRGSEIGAQSVVSADCRVGRDCRIGPGVVVQHALIGDRVVLHPGVKVGQDGFGYIGGPAGHRKVPQIGRVIIQNDVEIGANTTVDRGALGDTVIGEGTKIDNLVQIAHNVVIGRHCVIAGQVGLSGSVTLGDFVMLGGGVGVADHRSVGAGARVGARAGVMHDVPPGETWLGAPAKPFKKAMREFATLTKLAEKGFSGAREGEDS